MIGFVFAFMLFATIAFILFPLLRSRNETVLQRTNYEIGIYRDQLAEIEMDVERGLISNDRVEAARLEIQRRILAANHQPSSLILPENRRTNWIIAIFVAILIPFGAWQVYSHVGAPGLADQPFAARQNDPDMQLNAATEIIAATLAEHPDAKGFKRLAGMYYALHQYNRAATTYQKALDLNSHDAETWGELGESLVMENDGAVVMEAQDAFRSSLAQNKSEPRSRFYMGLADAQIGEFKRAIGIWRDIEKNAPADAPWLRMVQDNIRLYAKQGGFDPNSVTPISAK